MGEVGRECQERDPRRGDAHPQPERGAHEERELEVQREEPVEEEVATEERCLEVEPAHRQHGAASFAVAGKERPFVEQRRRAHDPPMREDEQREGGQERGQRERWSRAGAAVAVLVRVVALHRRRVRTQRWKNAAIASTT